jgi:peptidoglycan/LPS O-acetylase OafA/YrhL
MKQLGGRAQSSLLLECRQRSSLAQDRSIPSLDGLRAISVLLVVFGHSESAWRGHSDFYFYFIRGGWVGVSVFFVISGFLITHLLLREKSRSGQISLGRFYVRRAFRILPPCYAYLAVVGIRSLLHVEPVDPRSFIQAACYLWNYPHPSYWILGHLWSLSLEEQFYLLWPACVFLCPNRICLRIAIGAVVLAPVSRVATYFLLPALRGELGEMLHTRIDTIMFGCILALAFDLKVWNLLLAALTRLRFVIPAAVFLVFVEVPLTLRFRGHWSAVAGTSIEGLCCAIVVLYAVRPPQNWFGRLLNFAPVRHIGIISYSIYLWQQMFTGHEPFSSFPWNLTSIFICAELSYFLVEKPSFYGRDRFLKWIGQRRSLDSQTIPSETSGRASCTALSVAKHPSPPESGIKGAPRIDEISVATQVNREHC